MTDQRMAAEVGRLEAENIRLKQALLKIMEYPTDELSLGGEIKPMKAIAAGALAERD